MQGPRDPPPGRSAPAEAQGVHVDDVLTLYVVCTPCRLSLRPMTPRRLADGLRTGRPEPVNGPAHVTRYDPEVGSQERGESDVREPSQSTFLSFTLTMSFTSCSRNALRRLPVSIGRSHVIKSSKLHSSASELAQLRQSSRVRGAVVAATIVSRPLLPQAD